MGAEQQPAEAAAATSETPASPAARPAEHHEHADHPARMHAITISRTYGSGGGEVAQRLAERLGWHLLDHEMVAQVASQLGLSTEEADAKDERVEGFIAHVLHSLSLAYPGYPDISGELPPSPTDMDQLYQEALRRVIVAAAHHGRAVIVGRGSFALLADRRDVLRVLVVAPLEQRVRYVARREGLDERAARERIQRKDQDRQRHIETHYHLHPGTPDLYDLCINTAVLTLDDAVDLTCRALEQKGHMLGVPEADLGPGVGMARYPSAPADIPLPAADAEAPQEAQT